MKRTAEDIAEEFIPQIDEVELLRYLAGSIDVRPMLIQRLNTDPFTTLMDLTDMANRKLGPAVGERRTRRTYTPEEISEATTKIKNYMQSNPGKRKPEILAGSGLSGDEGLFGKAFSLMKDAKEVSKTGALRDTTYTLAKTTKGKK